VRSNTKVEAYNNNKLLPIISFVYFFPFSEIIYKSRSYNRRRTVSKYNISLATIRRYTYNNVLYYVGGTRNRYSGTCDSFLFCDRARRHHFFSIHGKAWHRDGGAWCGFSIEIRTTDVYSFRIQFSYGEQCTHHIPTYII